MNIKHEHEELEDILDAMIKDFNSSDEEEKVQEPEVLDIDIDTPTPTPTPTRTPTPPNLTPKHLALPDRIPKSGSAWLKKVQHHRSSASQETDVPLPSPDVKFDSAKKKPKFKRSGLAEQLQRLVNREKSEKSFWAHKQAIKTNDPSATSTENSSSALDVQILSLQTQYCLHITRCCVLSNRQESTVPYILDVVFNTQTIKQLTLRVGSAVRIHPPWQKLHVPSSPYPTLLCTYYCAMLPTPSGPHAVDVTSLPDLNWPRNKPVQQTSHLVSSPKKSFQPTRLLFGEPQTTKEDATDSSVVVSEVGQPIRTKNMPSIAKAIEAQGGCSGGCVCFEAVVQRVYKRRVKVAREKALDSPGDVFLSKTLVTRARSAEDKEELRWVMLVQDSCKNVCEIQVPEEYASRSDWFSCIKKGTRKSYQFNDLRIAQRTNRTRSPGLFDVMDSLWWSDDRNSCQENKSSQIVSSDENSSQTSKQTSPPHYCYVLTVQDSSQVTSIDCDQYQDLSALYTPSLPRSLRELIRPDEYTPKRCAIWCRAICSRSSLKNANRQNSNQLTWIGQVFVTDASLHHPTEESQDTNSSELLSRCVKLEVRASNVLTDSVRRALGQTSSVLYLEDVACSRKEGQGTGIYADSYTTIKRGSTDPCQADVDKGDVQIIPLNIYSELVSLRTSEFILPLLLTTAVGSLCKVQGIVHGVDEESACCWLECATCSCQDLVERNGLSYYCPFCKIDVQEPQTKTNLDVNIRCDSWKGHVIVKLLQTTIEQLLPVSYQNSDQGYDIERVLGKRLGPLYCYVKEHTRLTAKLDEIAVSL